MRKVAAHRLILSATESVSGPLVVRLADDGMVVDYERLQGEQPGVEWLGGIFLLLPAALTPGPDLPDFVSWYEAVNPVYSPDTESYALWHVGDVPVTAALSELSRTSLFRL